MSPQLKVQGAPLQWAPPVFAAKLDDWVESGLPPDSELLRAILDNDLGHTIAVSSSTEWELIRETQRWLWNHAPPQCYGSKYHVVRWLQRRGRPW
jgi:hypothetical protein